MKKQRFLAILLSLVMVLAIIAGCAPAEQPPPPAPEPEPTPTPAPTPPPAPPDPPEVEAVFTPGTFTGVGIGWDNDVTVAVTFSETEIVSVEIVEHTETPGVSTPALVTVPNQIVEFQTLNVDATVGATVTRMGVIVAVQDAISQAGGNPADFMTAIDRGPIRPIEMEVDVVIVGAGGAGMAAAVAALDEGANVLLLERTAAVGGNTLAAGNGHGSWNAVMPEVFSTLEALPGQAEYLQRFLEMNPADFAPGFSEALVIAQNQIREYLAGDTTYQFDSIEFHIVQTYTGSIRYDLDGNRVHSLYDFVRIMVEGSPEAVEWMRSMGTEWGDELGEPIGAMWRRGMRGAVNNQVSWFEPLIAAVGRLGGEIMFNTRADSLIIENGDVVGVNATRIDGTPVTVRASSVVLATGGFAANTDMVVQYNNFFEGLTHIGSTNVLGAMGDGIVMAQEAGAGILHMGITQIMPIGFAADGTLALGTGGNVMYVGLDGRRFVNEGSERDILAAAAFGVGGTFFEIGRQQDDIVRGGRGQLRWVGDGTGRIFAADTLAELAAQLGIDPEALEEEVAQFNEFAENLYDPVFGRTIFHNTITGSYRARVLAPSAHYTNGGLTTNTDSQVLDTAGNPIPNLFAAGEVMGGIHGGNRLGGNAIPEAFVFGRIAGTQAAANAAG
jgi:fumarate reductase flavoprotein subunit